MQVTIYLDLIFLINFIVEIYVLLITGRIMRQNMNKVKIGLGALLESLLLLPLVLYPRLLIGLRGILLSIGISMGTVWFSLGRKGGLIKKWFLSTTVMILFAGVFQLLKNVSGIIHINIYIWMILFLSSGLISNILLKIILSSKQKRNHIYRICLMHDGNYVEADVYMDTGNRLKDHLVGKPVLLLSEEIIEKLLPEDEKCFINEYRKNGYIDYENPILTKLNKNIFFHEIEFQSVGEMSGKLLCFMLDCAEIKECGKCYKKQPVAIIDSSLFFEKCYSGLLFSDDI